MLLLLEWFEVHYFLMNEKIYNLKYFNIQISYFFRWKIVYKLYFTNFKMKKTHKYS